MSSSLHPSLANYDSDRTAATLPPNHVENGRTFHGFHKGMYMYPCDEVIPVIVFHTLPASTDHCLQLQQEKDRMDIFHKLFLVARHEELHRVRLNPNQEPLRILDLGTGTGIWAIDMAE